MWDDGLGNLTSTKEIDLSRETEQGVVSTTSRGGLLEVISVEAGWPRGTGSYQLR